MKIQSSTNKKQGPGGDLVNFQRGTEKEEKINHCNIIQKPDKSCLDDEKQNLCKDNIRKSFTVQKSVNIIYPENEKQNLISKANMKINTRAKTQLTTSVSTFNKISTIKKNGNSLLNRPPFK